MRRCPVIRTVAPRYTIAAWVLTGVALILILKLRLLPALLAGMLVYELVHVIAPTMNQHLSNKRAKLIAVGLLSILVVALVTIAIIGALVFFRSDAGNLPALFARMAEIIDSSRAASAGMDGRKNAGQPGGSRGVAVRMVPRSRGRPESTGKDAGRGLAHALIGMVLGAMIALHEAMPIDTDRPLARELAERLTRLGDAFRRVVFAQVKISLINTALTGIYLALVLPAFGVNLPFKRTLIALTFITGLLPVLGNLVSNTVIVVVSLSTSPQVAISSLLFLVIIHKLEYFLNARIVGSRTECRAWELLLAMVVMEAAFGIPGLIAAPIYYTYLKAELSERGLI